MVYCHIYRNVLKVYQSNLILNWFSCQISPLKIRVKGDGVSVTKTVKKFTKRKMFLNE